MKRKTILRWALCAAVLLAAVALIGSVALSRASGGVMFGAAGSHNLSGTMRQPGATMLNGGRYQLANVTLSDAQGSAWQESDLASGGRYKLTDVTISVAQGSAWQENDLASGGGYHLQRAASLQLTDYGCCCIYLPCVKR